METSEQKPHIALTIAGSTNNLTQEQTLVVEDNDKKANDPPISKLKRSIDFNSKYFFAKTDFKK